MFNEWGVGMIFEILSDVIHIYIYLCVIFRRYAQCKRLLWKY